MTLSELLLSLCGTYPQNLSDDVYDREVYLRIKSEKLNCDVEISLDSIYKRDYLDRTRDEIVFEFTDI